MAAEKESRFSSFKNFWPYYLNEHDHPYTRAVHALGTSIGAIATVAAAITFSPLLIPVGIVAIYGVLTASHSIFQGNIPATFQKFSIKNILWSAAGDFKMSALWFTGRASAEYTKLGLDPTGSKSKAAKKKAEKSVQAAPETRPAAIKADASVQGEFSKAAEEKPAAPASVVQNTPAAPSP